MNWEWNNKLGYWSGTHLEGWRAAVISGHAGWGVWLRPPGLTSWRRPNIRHATADLAMAAVDQWLREGAA